jgi:hypothetical protein
MAQAAARWLRMPDGLRRALQQATLALYERRA